MNRKCVRMLEEWDPFKIGTENYETETADVVAALQGIDEPAKLAKVIQTVYEYSFEEWIPLEQCVAMASKLLAVKFEAKCRI